MPDSVPLVALLATLIGVIAGLRAMIAPAAVSWAASLGWLDVSGTWLAFLGYTWTPWILSVLTTVELVTDQLPSTPSRTVPVQFGARLAAGALSGAAISAGSDMLIVGVVAGVIGALIGTLGGRMLRARLTSAFRKDRPAAIIEDLIALAGAVLAVSAARS